MKSPGHAGRFQQTLRKKATLARHGRESREGRRCPAAPDGRGHRPRNPLDMITAAVAESNDCVVVTDSGRDFAGVKIVNPMRGGG